METSSAFFSPSDSQLAKINSLVGWESPKENWLLLKCRASDNLVNRSYRKWSLNVLTSMQKTCINNPVLLDHEWHSVDSSCGFILDAELVKTSDIPENQKLDFESINKKIMQKEGYVSLIVTVAIPALESMYELVNQISTKCIDACSTGGEIEKIKTICPNCSEAAGRAVSFTDKDKAGRYICPHYIPYWLNDDEEDDDSILVADYVELDGVYENFELSFCNIGNLPNAKILR